MAEGEKPGKPVTENDPFRSAVSDLDPGQSVIPTPLTSELDQALINPETSVAESLKATFDLALYDNLFIDTLETVEEISTRDRNEPLIPREQLNELFPDMPVPFTFDMRMSDAKRAAEVQAEKRRLENVIGFGPQNPFQSAINFGAGAAALVVDPVAILSGVGVARMITKLPQLYRLGRMTPVLDAVARPQTGRAKFFSTAFEGFVGNAIVEPINFISQARDRDDVHATDTLATLATFSVAFGGLRALGAKGIEYFNRRDQRTTHAIIDADANRLKRGQRAIGGEVQRMRALESSGDFIRGRVPRFAEALRPVDPSPPGTVVDPARFSETIADRDFFFVVRKGNDLKRSNRIPLGDNNGLRTIDVTDNVYVANGSAASNFDNFTGRIVRAKIDPNAKVIGFDDALPEDLASAVDGYFRELGFNDTQIDTLKGLSPRQTIDEIKAFLAEKDLDEDLIDGYFDSLGRGGVDALVDNNPEVLGIKRKQSNEIKVINENVLRRVDDFSPDKSSLIKPSNDEMSAFIKDKNSESSSQIYDPNAAARRGELESAKVESFDTGMDEINSRFEELRENLLNHPRGEGVGQKLISEMDESLSSVAAVKSARMLGRSLYQRGVIDISGVTNKIFDEVRDGSLTEVAQGLSKKSIRRSMQGLDELFKNDPTTFERTSREFISAQETFARKSIIEDFEDQLHIANAAERIISQFGDKPDEGILSLLRRSNFAVDEVQLNSVAPRSDTNFGDLVLEFTRIMDELPPHISEAIKTNNESFMIDLFDEIKFGAAGRKSLTGNDGAFLAAKKFRAYNNLNLEMMKNAGSTVSERAGYIVKNFHNSSKIRKAGETEWVDFVANRIDKKASFPRFFNDEKKVRDSIRGIYRQIAEGESMNTYGSTLNSIRNPDNILSAHRTLEFGDGKSLYEYMKRFGDANFVDSIHRSAKLTARNSAIISVLGRRGLDNVSKLLSQVKERLVEAGNSKAVQRLETPQFRFFLERTQDTAKGVPNRPGINMYGKTADAINKSQVVSLLGSVVRTILGSDVATGAEVIRTTQGKNIFSATGDAVIGTILNISNRTRRRAVARELRILTSATLNDTNQRWMSAFDESRVGLSTKIVNAFMKYSGANVATDSTMLVAGEAWARHIGGFIAEGRSFDSLNKSVSGFLRVHGIDEKRYRVLAKSLDSLEIRHADNGVVDKLENVIIPENISKIPLDDFTEIAKEKRITKERARSDLRISVINAINDTAEMTASLGGIREKTATTFGFDPNTPLGAGMKLYSLFKAPSHKMFNTNNRLSRLQGNVTPVINIITLTTVFGLMTTSLFDIIQGKEPRSPTDPKAWLEAMVRGGALFYLGDALFAESQFNRSPLKDFAGPGFARIDDLVTLLRKGMSGERVAPQALAVAKNMMPYQNLFWTKAAFDRLIYFQLQEMVNPGYTQRMKRRLQEQEGAFGGGRQLLDLPLLETPGAL